MDGEILKKYSYLISGDTILSVGQGHMQGTGFFIKRGNKVFFACAKHTLSGCNDKNEKDSRTPDKMKIQLSANSNIEADVKSIKDTAPCLPMFLDPDIFALPIDTGINIDSIQYVNDFEGEMPEKFSELVVWGYPDNKNEINFFDSNKFSVATNVPVVLDDKSYVDNIHYCIGIEDKSIDGLVGFSGCPVFLKNRDTGNFVFIGVLVGTHKGANGLYVVQPKYLYNLISE